MVFRHSAEDNPPPDDLEAIGRVILDCAFEVHRKIGPDMVEKAYAACLAHVLEKNGVRVEREVAFPLYFDGERVEGAFRIDLVVEDAVAVEIKVAERYHPVHLRQLLSYLRFGGYRLGYLLNFHEKYLMHGIRRAVLTPLADARSQEPTEPE